MMSKWLRGKTDAHLKNKEMDEDFTELCRKLHPTEEVYDKSSEEEWI